jgi:DNA-binding MarR family transcriptional regulator
MERICVGLSPSTAGNPGRGSGRVTIGPMAPPVATDLGGQLRLAVLRLSRRLRQEAAGDVTPSQLSALSVLSARGELTLGELASIERIAPPSMTRIAARLEARGLLERRSDATDRRIARVAVSKEGYKFLDETRTRRDAYLSGRLQDFSVEERRIIEAAVPLLARLAAEKGS